MFRHFFAHRPAVAGALKTALDSAAALPGGARS
jgi:hypothetical protein